MNTLTVFIAAVIISASDSYRASYRSDVDTRSLWGKNVLVLTLKPADSPSPVDGYLAELLELLQVELGFNATVEEVEKRGGMDIEGKWDGMIGRLVDGTADLALADLTITSVREDAIDFTIPFITTGVAILIKKTDVVEMKSAKDLAAQEAIRYGAVNGGSTQNFFRKSDDPLYSNMYDQMSGSCPQSFVGSVEEGIQKVKAGGFAMLMESLSIKHVVSTDCDLMELGHMLNTVKHAIGTQKKSPFTAALSHAITQLQERGKLSQLKTKYWRDDQSTECS